MSINQFVAFATAPGANVIEQEDYLTDPIVPTGFTMGLLYSAKTNKVWRQSSFVASCLAELMRVTLDEDISDDGDTGKFTEQLRETIFQVCAGFEPLGDAPEDGFAYGRRNLNWVQVVNKSGDRMNGELILSRFPMLGMEAVNKQYVDNLVAGLAPIFSPVFTGVPRAPTPPDDSVDDKIATCAFVRRVFGGLVTGVSYVRAGPGLSGGGSGDVTIQVQDYGVTNGMLSYMASRSVKANIAYASAPAVDIGFATFLAELGAAPINSPNFTGVPTVPDPGSNISNQIASTRWVSDRFLRLTGGTLYNANTDNLFHIRVDPGRDNYIAYYGDRTWSWGAAATSRGGHFGLYDASAGRWNFVSYPNGMFWVLTSQVMVSGNGPPADFSAGLFTDILSTAGDVAFNAYWGNNAGYWTRMYDGYSTVLAMNTGRFIFYTSGYGAARAKVSYGHTAQIELNRIHIWGDNSPGYVAWNNGGGGPFGWTNSGGSMHFGACDGSGNIATSYAHFWGGDGGIRLSYRAHILNGATIYGNDSIYIEGYQGHSRIYYANAGRTWLVGCRRDNGNFTWQDASGGYAEVMNLDPAGALAIANRLYTNNGAHLRGNDPLYLESGGNDCRIYYTCNTRVWLVGVNVGNPNFVWLDGSAGYVERMRLQYDGHLVVQRGVHCSEGFNTGGTSIIAGTEFHGSIWVRDHCDFGTLTTRGTLTTNGFLTANVGASIGGNNQFGFGLTVMQAAVVHGYTYLNGGLRVSTADPITVNCAGTEGRIHYWAGGLHWLVGGNANNLFAWWSITAESSRQLLWLNNNGSFFCSDWIQADGFFSAPTRATDKIEDTSPGALDTVLAVRPIISQGINPYTRREVRRRGFLGPDMEAAVSEAVRKGDRGEQNGIDVMALITVLWQAVQELNAKLEERA